MMESVIAGMLKGKLPEFSPNYCYHLAWLYEEDNNLTPNEIIHNEPKEALEHLIRLFNAPKTLVHISLSRRNA